MYTCFMYFKIEKFKSKPGAVFLKDGEISFAEINVRI